MLIDVSALVPRASRTRGTKTSTSRFLFRKTFSCEAEKTKIQFNCRAEIGSVRTLTRMRESRLLMCWTLFSTSSSVTSIRVQFSSSSIMGYTPYPVTHTCSLI